MQTKGTSWTLIRSRLKWNFRKWVSNSCDFWKCQFSCIMIIGKFKKRELRSFQCMAGLFHLVFFQWCIRCRARTGNLAEDASHVLLFQASSRNWCFNAPWHCLKSDHPWSPPGYPKKDIRPFCQSGECGLYPGFRGSSGALFPVLYFLNYKTNTYSLWKTSKHPYLTSWG